MPFAGPESARFSYFEFVRDWPELVVAMNQLESRLRRQNSYGAADRLLRAVDVLNKELEELGVRAATRATEILRESERRTRVRPDTGGAGGRRLEDSLFAEPVGEDVLPGSIGVADEELLDNDVPWWITNEEGSSALVGHRLFGTFSGGEGGDSPPNADLFQQHALFTPGKGPNAGGGIIKNPIPARRFVLKAIPEINAMWQADFRQIKARFDNELSGVLAMAQVRR